MPANSRGHRHRSPAIREKAQALGRVAVKVFLIFNLLYWVELEFGEADTATPGISYRLTIVSRELPAEILGKLVPALSAR